MLLVPAARAGEFSGGADDRASWERADIAAGLPQVYTATSEAFVAQMLNLDLLGAIAFDKGCYTGQEVIARAHYRGRVKRRLQRWHATAGDRAAARATARVPAMDAHLRWCARRQAWMADGICWRSGHSPASVGAGIDRAHAARCVDSGWSAAAALFTARIGVTDDAG